MQFGIEFSSRNPTSPRTREEAVAYVRRWAAREGVEIPDDAEPEFFVGLTPAA